MGTELRDCVSGICMKEEMRKAVIEHVRERTGNTAGGDGRAADDNRKRGNAGTADNSRKTEYIGTADDNRKKRQEKQRIRGWKRTAAAAALLVALIGAAAVPVRALINSIVQERMEQMPQAEKETYTETLMEQKVAADGFSRAYTQEEECRYREMGEKYQEGTFPEKAVIQVETQEEAKAYEFCYLISTDTFCLPERELTDEELLEIIDFTVKREYAYTEYYEAEHAAEIAEEKQKEQEKIAANTEDGGIAEKQAEEIAAQKLSAIYGVDTEGFEMNSYYDEEIYDGRAAYCVNWTNIITHQYYYFFIDAKDGHMLRASHSGADLSDAPFAGSEEIEAQIPVLSEKARDFMREQIGETYDEVYVSYLLYPDKNAGTQVGFYLAKEDGSAYEIVYLWDGTLIEIAEKKDISGKEDGKPVKLWDGESYTEVKEVFRRLEG